MNDKNSVDHIKLSPEIPAVPVEIERDLASRNIAFMMPAEVDMVGGAATLQFAYDKPLMYA
jgi:hypothetical protein